MVLGICSSDSAVHQANQFLLHTAQLLISWHKIKIHVALLGVGNKFTAINSFNIKIQDDLLMVCVYAVVVFTFHSMPLSPHFFHVFSALFSFLSKMYSPLLPMLCLCSTPSCLQASCLHGRACCFTAPQVRPPLVP